MAVAESETEGGPTPPNVGSPGRETQPTSDVPACLCRYDGGGYYRREEGGWVSSGYAFVRVPPEGGCGATWFHSGAARVAAGWIS